MKKLLCAFAAGVLVLMTGCASTPKQEPVSLSKGFNAGKPVKIGVVMSALPKVDTQFPGADCLLCLGVASLANRTLTQHVQTLPQDDLAQLKAKVGETLRAKGHEVVIISEPINLAALPKAKKEGVNLAREDYTSLKDKYKVDKIAVVHFYTVGVVRSYSAYVATSDPKATIGGLAYIVDTSTNAYDLYLPIAILKSAGLKWDEPTKFPGLTTAYFQAIEDAKDLVIDSLEK